MMRSIMISWRKWRGKGGMRKYARQPGDGEGRKGQIIYVPIWNFSPSPAAPA